MLFSNSFQPQDTPYYSDYNQDPAYIKAAKALQKKKTGTDAGFIAGETASSALSFIPFVGPALAAGAEAGLAAGQKKEDAKLAKEQSDLVSHYSSIDHPKDNNTSLFGGFSGASAGNLGNLTQNKGFMQFLNGQIQQNKDSAFSASGANGLAGSYVTDGTLGSNTGGLGQDTSTPIDLTSGGGSSNFDFSSFGGSDVPATPTTGFYRGGLAPLGKNDI